MQIKVIVQKSIIGCLIQLEEKRKVKYATCSDIHAHRKTEREREKKEKSKEQSRAAARLLLKDSIIIKRVNKERWCSTS